MPLPEVPLFVVVTMTLPKARAACRAVLRMLAVDTPLSGLKMPPERVAFNVGRPLIVTSAGSRSNVPFTATLALRFALPEKSSICLPDTSA